MKIQWLGHACFSVTLSDGRTVITDPFDKKLGYPQPKMAAQFVTVSHQHFDHNAVQEVPGNPVAVQKEGRHSFGDISFTGIPSFHDASGGSKRGKNIIFIIEAEGLRVCHLGDLGHVIDSGQARVIGRVDILMVPVGGFYTIGPDEAVKVVDLLNPAYVLPMHYRTGYIDLPIGKAEDFLKYYSGFLTLGELEAAAGDLPKGPRVVRLDLKK